MVERTGAGSVLVTNGSGCGSGRPKNIRILIPKTAGNLIAPRHCPVNVSVLSSCIYILYEWLGRAACLVHCLHGGLQG
jgi:hypothetical protein